VLYYFRSPPSVRIGREALDPETMRLLEAHNPDITFDWDRLRSARPPAGPVAGSTAGAGPGPGDERRRERRDPRRRAAPAVNRPESEPSTAGESAEPVETLGPGDRPPDLDPPDAEPVVTGTAPAAFVPADSGEEQAIDPRYARVGAAGLLRLRARYADIRAKLAARPCEETERTELYARLERLNPDAWLSPEEVAHALEDYEAVFESLRPLVGRQPRSPRL
jgi:hypothetical protein